MSTTVTTHSNDGTVSRRPEVQTHVDWKSIPKGDSWATDHLPLAKRDYWRHMSKLDKGIKKGCSWFDGSLITHFHNRDLIQLLTDALELRPMQATRAKDYFLAQDLRRWGIRKELVAWATCAYIVHSDRRDGRKCHPEVDKDADELFIDLASISTLRTETVGRHTERFRVTSSATGRVVYKPSSTLYCGEKAATDAQIGSVSLGKGADFEPYSLPPKELKVSESTQFGGNQGSVRGRGVPAELGSGIPDRLIWTTR